MFGMLAARPVSPRALLRDGPRSLWTLSAEHPDGWGVAIDDGEGWSVHRDTACAQRSPEFADLAAATRARVVVAHVRQKTVGPTALANTHPFRDGRLVFAHNGTVARPDALAAQTSASRLAAVVGDTDSERLFAFIASHVDRAGAVEGGVRAAVAALHAAGDLGSLSFPPGLRPADLRPPPGPGAVRAGAPHRRRRSQDADPGRRQRGP
jgi:predicted glutamine amidotransferase